MKKSNIVKNFAHILIVIVLLFVSLLNVCAHKINGYKFIHIEESGNLYGVEDRLTQYFTNLGFETVASYNIEDMTNSDKGLLLIATYDWNIVYGGHSTLKLTLKDVTGTIVFKAVGQGISFSAKGDMKNALKKILKQIDNLHYVYTPDLNKVKRSTEIPFSTWSEDEIKNHLKTKNISSIEGIYKNFSNNLDYYRIAILKDHDTYYGIIVDTENKRWEKGDTKIVLSHIERNNYDVEYYNFKGKKINAIGSYDSRIFTFSYDDNGKAQTIQFLKVFPASTADIANNNESAKDVDLKSTGSGIIISKNILVTNYHVVDDAEKIKVVLNTNGIPEEYNARVLSVDKTNDLALVAIKDEKFRPLPPSPYSISSKVVDVGTSIFTMGYPLTGVMGKEVKITDGLISSKTGYQDDAVTYQISAPIQSGNSGGALFDRKGNLVGITNAGITSADNVGYAIKSSYLLNLIDSAPITIELPKGEDLAHKELTDIIKLYTPYVALIKVY